MPIEKRQPTDEDEILDLNCARDERLLLHLWNGEGVVNDYAVDPLSALAANTELVKLLTRRRWLVMMYAREAGATWDELAQALQMTRGDAYHFYHQKIESQRLLAQTFERSLGFDYERAKRAGQPDF